MTAVLMTSGVRDGQWLRLARAGPHLHRVPLDVQPGRTGPRSAACDLICPPRCASAWRWPRATPRAPRSTEIDALRVHNLDSQAATSGWPLDEMGAAAGGTAIHEADGLKRRRARRAALAAAGLGPASPSRALSGEQMLTVKVGAFTHGNAPARVGLMLREGPPIQLLSRAPRPR